MSMIQTNRCLVCKRKSKQFNLCGKCITNPFRIEDLRAKLAKENSLKALKNTYSKEFPEIKNINSGKFWNIKLNQEKKFSGQDGMTKDRVNTTFSFIPKSVKKVLDIGAGNGFIEEFLSKNPIYKIYGIDISSYAINNLKLKFRGNFSIRSVYSLNFPERFFDLVFVLEVMEHIPPSKTLLVFKGIRKVLKNGGYLILSVPLNEHLENMPINLNGHLRVYTEDLIFRELELNNFRVVKSKKFFAFKKFYLVKKVISFFFQKKWQPNNIVILAKAL